MQGRQRWHGWVVQTELGIHTARGFGLEETGRRQSGRLTTVLMVAARAQFEAPRTGRAYGQVAAPSKAMSLFPFLPEATLGLGNPKQACPPLLPN